MRNRKDALVSHSLKRWKLAFCPVFQASISSTFTISE